jgi:RNA recognition motif-containing protein
MEKDKSVQHKLFVGCIPTEVSEKELRENFSKYGNITDLIIIKDKHSKKSRGFGFVTFKEKKSMKKILKEKHRLRDKSLEIKPAEPKKASKLQEIADTSNITKVFVGGIPKNADSSHLTECFGKYGEIAEASVIEDKKTNEQRGFGFVNFKDVESVKKVMEDYSSHQILGKWVECKVALPKSVSDPTTNADITYQESSSEEEEENPLKPVPSPENEPQTIQHSSVPHLVMPSKVPVSQKELKSQAKIKQKKKADKKPGSKKQSNKHQTFDFGDFVADYEEEEDEVLNKISYDHQQIDAEMRVGDDQRASRDRATVMLDPSSVLVSDALHNTVQQGRKKSGLRQWTEVHVDPQGRMSEYRFSQRTGPAPSRLRLPNQPSFSMQDGFVPLDNGTSPSFLFPQFQSTHLFGGRLGLAEGGYCDSLGEFCRTDQPETWPSTMSSAVQSPQQLAYSGAGQHHNDQIQYTFSGGFYSPIPIDVRRVLHPSPSLFQPSHKLVTHHHYAGEVIGNTSMKMDKRTNGMNKICSEYRPSLEERYLRTPEGVAFTRSDNLITIKDRWREAVHPKPKTGKKQQQCSNQQTIAHVEKPLEQSENPNFDLQHQFPEEGM